MQAPCHALCRFSTRAFAGDHAFSAGHVWCILMQRRTLAVRPGTVRVRAACHRMPPARSVPILYTRSQRASSVRIRMRIVASRGGRLAFTGSLGARVKPILFWPGYCLCLTVHGNDVGRVDITVLLM